MSVQSYHDWAQNSQPLKENLDSRIKHVYTFEEIGDALVEAGLVDYIMKIGQKVKNRMDKIKKAQDDIKKKKEKAAIAAKKAADFKNRGGKSKDPEAQKIASNRSSEEMMKQKIAAAEANVLMMKQQLAQSEIKTAEIRKKKAEKIVK